MNSKLYNSLKSVFGYSYSKVLAVLTYQFDKEKKQSVIIEETSVNSASNTSSEDVLYNLLHRYQINSYRLMNDSNKSFELADEMSLEDEDNNHDFSITSSDECWYYKFIPNKFSSHYYVVLYVVALLYEYSIGTSNVFESFHDSKELNTETYELINTVINVLINPISITTQEAEIYSVINEICESCISTKNVQSTTANDLDLRFKLCVYMIKFVYSRRKIDFACRQAAARIALEYMTRLYRRNDYKRTIRFASFSFGIIDEIKRCQGFNFAGLSALYCKQYQLSYDLLLSWINKSLLDNVKSYFEISANDAKYINEALKSKREDTWRDKNAAYVVAMFSNTAYICTEIFDYLGPTKDGFLFLQIAKYYNELARSKDKLNSSFSLMYHTGSIMVYDLKYDQAVDMFESCYNSIKRYSHINIYNRMSTSALRLLITNYPNVSTKRTDKWFDGITDEYISCYNQALNSVSQNSNEILYGRNLFYLLTSCKNLSSRRKRMIIYLLLNINNDARKILQCLRRRSSPFKKLEIRRECYSEEKILFFESNIDYSRISKSKESERNGTKKIAYYTTLDNLQYIFDKDLEKDNTVAKSEANRLTMMHARYMNDPDEGLVLLNNLKEYLCVSPEELRNTLYDQKYIFLKSFTGLVDQLNMWTLYGSDRESGKDCNGCCICFEPESFIYIPENDYSADNDSNPSTKSNRHIDDDYDLYNVAYIDGERLFVDGESSELLENCYADLKNQLSALHQIIRYTSYKDKVIISNCLVRLLEKPMFLFKDISYCLEGESRIIISRDFNDRVEIKKTSQGKDPRKIFINPPLQMFPERIILGPKVENDDYWMPYLQYKLSEIKDKWEYEKDYNPKVRKSKINIR